MFNPKARITDNVTRADEIFVYVERALNDYHFIPALARSRLVQVLDLEPFRKRGLQGPAAEGWALRRALDAGIEAIIGDALIYDGNDGRTRVERYLHWRYRAKLNMREISARLHYSPRQLQRLRDDLIEQLAQILLEIAPPN